MAVHDSPAPILGSKYARGSQGHGYDLLAAAELNAEALDLDDVGELWSYVRRYVLEAG